MGDREQTKEQLIRELADARRRLEVSETERGRLEGELAREIRDHGKAQETLQASESRFRSLVENSSDIIWETDENDVLTYVSPKIKAVLGYEPEEVIGRTPYELLRSDESKRLQDVTDRIQRPFSGLEATFLHKDGRQVVLETGGERDTARGGSSFVYRGISRDVTKRKEAEEALRESEERYHQIFDSIVDSLFVGDLDGRIVAANPAACDTHGYTQEEVIGLSVLKLIHPDDHHKFEEFLKVVETGGAYRAESLELRKDGSAFDVEVFGGPFIYRGKPHLLAIVRDITDRKKAEEALKRETLHLRRSLEVSDRDRQMISCEIHDGVAQQLAAAMMQFQASQSRHAQDDEHASEAFATGQKLLGEALAEARRLIRGLRPPILDELGLVAAVEHLIHGARSEGGPEIQLDADVEFDRLSGPLENSLFRIVQECLANACRHSESDRVRIALVQHATTLHLEVRDWGVGFDVESTKEGRFGLEIIQERARLLGGRATIKSKPGEGTCVTAEVPLL